MKSRLIVLTSLLIIALLDTSITHSQAPNPMYLREMPTEERILREVKGSDPIDTAARQFGAFEQLSSIIRDLALAEHRNDRQWTPDEQRLFALYQNASARAWQPVQKALAQDRPRMFKLSGYATNPDFTAELLNQFFSPQFRALYAKANQIFAKRHEEFEKQQKQEMENAKNQQDASANGTSDPSTLAMRRCVASGKSMTECLTASFAEFFGVKAEVPRPGLRLNSIYASQGINITFVPGSGAGSGGWAGVKCGDLEPEGRDYKVELKDDQVMVIVPNDPSPIILSYQSDGNLHGPGLTTFNGRVIVGYTKQEGVTQKRLREDQTYQYRPSEIHEDWSGYYVNQTTVFNAPVYKPKTERCSVSTLVSSGAPTHVSAEGVAGSLGKLFPDTSGKKLPPPPAGLRMLGNYADPSGFSIEFRASYAQFGCGDVAVLETYNVEKRNSQVMITIHNDPKPILLSVRPDGTLAGSGLTEINGREFVGVSGKDPVFQSKMTRCTIGSLVPTANTPTQIITPGPVTSTPSTSAGPAPASTNNTLTISSAPSVASLLAGKRLVLLKDSLENVLAHAGVSAQGRSSRIYAWLHACESSASDAVCQQGGKEFRNYFINGIPMDGTGSVAFKNVPSSGTLFIFVRTKDQMWNLKVDLKPGANSIRLDESNMTPIDR